MVAAMIDETVRGATDGYTLTVRIAGIAMSVAVCIWWFRISKTHRRHVLWRRITGYILFMFGSFGLFDMLGLVFLPAVQQVNVVVVIVTVIRFVMDFIFPAGLIVGAYFLVFKSNRRAGPAQ
jgi:hypothetical protein